MRKKPDFKQFKCHLIEFAYFCFFRDKGQETRIAIGWDFQDEGAV